MDTYYLTARARPNFTVYLYTKALAVLRNGAQITGVQIANSTYGGNGVVPLTTNGRVIVSGGAFGTSRLLFASGAFLRFVEGSLLAQDTDKLLVLIRYRSFGHDLNLCK